MPSAYRQCLTDNGKGHECVVLVRALGATRTRDLLLRRQLLYPLSYQGSCQRGRISP
jgi:hypothetical protein